MDTRLRKSIGMGTAFGIIVGAVIGEVTGNLGLWIAGGMVFGAVVGAAIGSVLASQAAKDNGDSRPGQSAKRHLRRETAATRPKNSRHLTRWSGPVIRRQKHEIIEMPLAEKVFEGEIPGRSARDRQNTIQSYQVM